MSSINRCDIGRSAGNFFIFIIFCILTACGGGGGDGTGATSNVRWAGSSPSGSMLYETNCQQCHQPLAVSTKLDKTSAAIQSAISSNTGNMGSLSKLSASEIQLIADALKTTQVIPSFNETNSNTFQLNGSAVLNNNSIRLTPNEQYKSGSAFLTSPFTLSSNFAFNAYFNFTLGADGRSSRHADGLVFALQTVSNKAGATGWGILVSAGSTLPSVLNLIHLKTMKTVTPTIIIWLL